MRLKARVSQVNLFLKVVQTVEKISKDCVIYLSTKKVQFILATDTVTDGVQVWSGLNAGTLFDDYRIESLNNNEISFQVNLDNLHRALKSGQSASEVVMKLTKKNNVAYLNFGISTLTSQQMMLTQDVPIELLSAQQLAAYVEPHLPDPEVAIMMPPLKYLRAVVDRMKNISEHLIIHANQGGELHLKVEEPLVTVATFYKGLEHPHIEGRPAPMGPEVWVEVKVDIKKFARFLYSYQVMPNNVICCIVKDRAVVLHVLLDDLYLTYYIPVISL